MSRIAREHGLVCLVTDRRRLAEGPGDERATSTRLVELVGAAARAGVDLIQVRERDLDARSLVELVARCVRATIDTPALVVVNDRVDVALAAGAAGVQLRGNAPPADRVRGMVPSGFLIGRSVHSSAEAVSATGQGGVDYLIFGAVFPSASKDPGHPTAGIAGLERVVHLVKVPVLAIGGITADRAEEVAKAGAAGVAAIGLFAVSHGVQSLDCQLDAIVAGLRRAFDTSGALP